MNTKTEKTARTIKLSQNENPFGPSPLAQKAIIDHVSSINRYPDHIPEKLKEKLAHKYDVMPENIAITAGSVELIDLLLKSFVGFDENIVAGDKSFVAYYAIAKINTRACKRAKLVDNTFDTGNLISACDDKTKVLFIANPNNPTGTIISHESLNELLQKIPPHVYVINDEAYFEYVTDATYPNSFSLLKKYPNLIVSRTFSKVYGLAGLRIGYTIARSDIIKSLTQSRIPFSVNRLAAIAALAALGETEFVEKCASINNQERTILYNEFISMGIKVTPTQANFIFVEFSTIDEKDRIINLLENNGVFVRDMTPFGAETGLRISVGRPEENRHLIKILKQPL